MKRWSLLATLLLGVAIAGGAIAPTLIYATHVRAAATAPAAEAAAHLRAALAWNRNGAEAWRLRGQQALATEHLEEALAAAVTYRRLRPADPAGALLEGDAWAALLRARRSLLPELRTAIVTDPTGTLLAQEKAAQVVQVFSWHRPGDMQPAPILFQAPPSRAMLQITLPEAPSALNFDVTLNPEAAAAGSDGVVFRVEVDAGLRYWEFVNPSNNNGWHSASLDLTPWAGRTITLTFGTDPGPNNDARFDWAAWRNPRLVPLTIAADEELARAGMQAAWAAAGVDLEALLEAGAQALDLGDEAAAVERFRYATLLADAPWARDQLALLSAPKQAGDPGLRDYQDYVVAQDGNLFVNPNFETSVGWSAGGPPASDVRSRWVADEAQAHGGGGVLYFDSSGGLSFGGGRFQPVALQPGSRYRFSAWIHAQGPAFRARLLYWESPTGTTTLSGSSAEQDGPTDGWQKVEGELVAPPADERVRLYPAWVEGPGRIWVDDVRLERLP